MISFPIQTLLDEEESYKWLLKRLHPEGLECPRGHKLPEGQEPHKRKNAPRVSYKCRECGKVYNIYTGTVWSGTHYECRTVVMIMRGFAQGKSTKLLSEELEVDYGTLLDRRHRIQEQAIVKTEEETLADEAVEGDELFQNAGEKGKKHPNPNDPPRQRSNPRRGRGTYETDRPVIVGVTGRASGELHLTVTTDTKNATIVPIYADQLDEETSFFSDEAHHFDLLSDIVAQHHSVAHGQDEYALDPDDDGFHEVHSNTIEGIWVGWRNFIRPLRGISKQHLPGYVAMFEWAYNLKVITDDFIRLLCCPDFTYLPT